MHNGFINVDNEKMSKSLGSFFTIRDVLGVRRRNRALLRRAQPLPQPAGTTATCIWTTRARAQAPVHGVVAGGAPAGRNRLGRTPRVSRRPWTDFGTPEAVAVLFELAGEVNRGKSPEVAGLLKALGAHLGLLQDDPEAFLKAGAGLDAAAIRRRSPRARPPRRRRTSPRPIASGASCWPRASCLKDSAAGTTWEAAQ